MRTVRTVLLAGAVLALAAPAVAATAVAQETTTPTPAGPGCEATSLTVVNDTAGTEFASFDADSEPFTAYSLTLTAEGATEGLGPDLIAPGASFESGPVGPSEYNLTAVPQVGQAPNLSLIYSGDITLTCESTTELSLVEFLGSTTPVAEDDGVGEADQAGEQDSGDSGSDENGSDSDADSDADADAGDDDIAVPTRIETGAGGTA